MLCLDETKQFCKPLANADMEPEVQKQKSIVGLETRGQAEPPERAAQMIKVSKIWDICLCSQFDLTQTLSNYCI